MSENMTQIKHRYLCQSILITLLCFAFACKPYTNEKSHISGSKKNTQALLLTQDFEFDPSEKNKVTSDYTARKEVIIPSRQ